MELTFRPSLKQFQAWELLTDKTTTELGFGGAAFGGKSYLECFWETAMCEAYPGTGWLLGRKELLNLKRTTLLTLFKVWEEYRFEPGKHFTYNQQSNIINWHNGSQIFLFDLGYQPSDPLYTRLGGLELTGAAVDESNEVPVQAINIVKTRIGRRLNDKYGLTPKLLETFNPDKGHVYSRYYKPWKDGTLPAHRRFIKALPTDNPHTTEEYLNQLRNADKVTKERLLYGNFEYDDDPTALIEYDAITDLFTNTVDPGEMYISADVARQGSDKIVIKLWRGLHNFKTIKKKKQGTDVTANDIKALEQIHKVPRSHVIIDEDGIGGGVVDQLPGCKGFIAQTKPFRDENYQNLKAQCTYLLAKKINAREIAITCDDPTEREETIEELEQIKSKDADKDGKLNIQPKDKIKEVLGRSPDYADALMMRMYFEFKAKPKLTFI
jgi:phage terminase large subunit